MNAITLKSDDPSTYALNLARYGEVCIPYWDQASKIVTIVATPLRMISWIYGYLTTDALQYRKKEPKGAPGHLLFGSYPELKERNFHILKFIADYNAEYGQEGICKLTLGPRVFYIVTDPEMIKNILQKPKSFVRGASLRVWQDKFSPGGLSEGEATQKYRKQAENAIGPSELPLYFPGMASIGKEWLERIGSFAGTGEALDLFYWAERAALATVGETLFKNDGVEDAENPFGLKPEDDKHCTAFLSAFHTLFGLLSMRITSCIANLPCVGDPLYRKLYKDEEQQLRQAKDTLKNILEPIFRSTLEGEIAETSHLKKLLDNFGIDRENPNYKEILDKSLGFMQASFETSSKAIGWILFHLARDPELQERLRKELFSTFEGLVPDSLDKLKSVPILSQIMEEILRLFPPFPLLVRDIEKPEDFNGYQVQKGAAFLISPYLIHRNPKNWPEPDKFYPERFRESRRPEEDMLGDSWQKSHHAYMPFLGGMHRCPGRHFGKQELLVLIASFVMRFRIGLNEGESEDKLDLKFNITLQPANPIYVKIEKI